MKPELLKISLAPFNSFSIRHDKVPHFFNKWHYHSEVELVYIEKGSGLQFIGDHISRFTSGDILLIGSNLPHYWRCDENYFKGQPDLFAEATVAHFLPNFLGTQFLDLPENKKIKALLQNANNGLKITGKTKMAVGKFLENILATKGADRIILVIKALHIMAISDDVKPLASNGFHTNYNESETERLNNIYNYSINNINKKISLAEIATVAFISPNAFCRYFKTQTKKTYSQFLLEIKIGKACKLLTENKESIKNVCYESGFNNFSNFNKYFKSITGKTPMEYKKLFADGAKDVE